MKRRKRRWLCALLLGTALTVLAGTAAYAAPRRAAMQKTVYRKNRKNGQWKKRRQASPAGLFGLFSRKYRVRTQQSVIRSGPGRTYPAVGRVYKNDVIRVKSIQNGWAKFKVNSRWCYIAQKDIVKVGRGVD